MIAEFAEIINKNTELRKQDRNMTRYESSYVTVSRIEIKNKKEPRKALFVFLNLFLFGLIMPDS